MYYLVIIQNGAAQAIYAHETLDSALSAFHSELAYRHDARTRTVCTILNSDGEMLRNEVYNRSVQEEVIEEPDE